MRFEFLPLRFEFIARESIHFPRGKAANVLRGALGTISRRIACLPECQARGDTSGCEIRHSCPWAKIFAPVRDGEGPAGLADPPRPFVFRARHLDGRTFRPGESFYFDLNVFSLDREVLACFVLTFAALAREGIGPRRGKADLLCVRRLAAGHLSEQVLCEGSAGPLTDSIEPVSLSLDQSAAAPTKIRVEFLSPTEIKHEKGVALRPEFPILFGRVRDRVSTLRALYGAGPLDIDFKAAGIRAAAVRMTRCELRRVESERRSGRTGQTHSLGGFVGFAEYEGDLAEFLPCLEAGRWTGVGRHSVWGNGEFSIAAIDRWRDPREPTRQRPPEPGTL